MSERHDPSYRVPRLSQSTFGTETPRTPIRTPRADAPGRAVVDRTCGDDRLINALAVGNLATPRSGELLAYGVPHSHPGERQWTRVPVGRNMRQQLGDGQAFDAH